MLQTVCAYMMLWIKHSVWLHTPGAKGQKFCQCFNNDTKLSTDDQKLKRRFWKNRVEEEARDSLWWSGLQLPKVHCCHWLKNEKLAQYTASLNEELQCTVALVIKICHAWLQNQHDHRGGRLIQKKKKLFNILSMKTELCNSKPYHLIICIKSYKIQSSLALFSHIEEFYLLV